MDKNITIVEPASHSLLLNSLLGLGLFVAGAFIIRYYHLEHVKRAHGGIVLKSSEFRGFVQSLFALVPYAMAHAALPGSHNSRMAMSAAFAFMCSSLGISIPILLSTKLPQLSTRSFTDLLLYTAFVLSASSACSLGALATYFSLGLYLLLTGTFFRRMLREDNTTPPESAYVRSPSIGAIIRLLRPLLFPLELLLDFALIYNYSKSKGYALRLQWRALIAPYINLGILLLYTGPFSFRQTILGLVISFILSIALSMSSISQRTAAVIPVYSAMTVCAYLYLILKEQLRISSVIAERLGFSEAIGIILYLVPQIVFYVLTTNSHFFSIGMRVISMHAAAFTTALAASSVLIGAGAFTFATGQGCTLGMHGLCALVLGAQSVVTLCYYTKMHRGMIVKDSAYCSVFAAVAYICILATRE